jgi:MurNAc alpha-1-phosphate uridylyltransferase
MEAMLLAAGRGQRLRPLTDTIPKPLIQVGNQALVEHHLLELAKQGFTHVVINTSYLSEMIVDFIGDGSRFGIEVSYSLEPDGPIGTAAGIHNALGLFNTDQDIKVINGDIYTDFNFKSFSKPEGSLIHLLLVPNPAHNPQGDFRISGNSVHPVKEDLGESYTYSGIGIFEKKLFGILPDECKELGDLIRHLVPSGKVTAEVYTSTWIDVGTIDRLEQARKIELLKTEL